MDAKRNRLLTQERESSLRDLLGVLFRNKWKTCFVFVVINVLVIVNTYLAAEIYRSEAKLLIRMGREDQSLDASVGVQGRVFQDFSEKVQSELAILNNRELIEKVVDKITVKKILTRPDEKDLKKGGAQEDLREVRRKSRKAKGLFRKTLIALDLVDELSDREKAIQKVIKNLSVEVPEGSSIIHLYYESQNPNVAQQILFYLIDAYMERHLEVYAAQESALFFKRKTEEKKADLTIAEEAFTSFGTQNKISTLAKQKELLLIRQDSLQSELDETESLVDAAKAKMDSLNDFLAKHKRHIETLRTSGTPNNTYTDVLVKWMDVKQKASAPKTSLQGDLSRMMSEAQDQLLDLRLKRVELVSRYLDDSREMKQIDGQIDILEGFINEEHTRYEKEIAEQVDVVSTVLKGEGKYGEEVTVGINLSFMEAEKQRNEQEAEYHAQRAKKRALDEALAVVITELHRLDALEIPFARVALEKEIIEKEYVGYRENWQRGMINSALDSDKISSVVVVQDATFPLGTIRPKKLLNIFLGFFVAFFFSIALAYLSEYFDHSIKSNNDVEKNLNLPVLATITLDDYQRVSSQGK